MASRAQDPVDILRIGWIAPPNIPKVVIEDRNHKLLTYFERPPKDGIIVVKKKYEDDYEDLSPVDENQVWTFKLVIIATTDEKLELLIRQAKEVFDRYYSNPFATETNGNLYDWGRLINGETSEVINSWTYDAWVQLANYVIEKVIA